MTGYYNNGLRHERLLADTNALQNVHYISIIIEQS